MNNYKAWIERESLSRNQLIRLLQQLKDEVVKYKEAIENYPPDRMEKYGKPYLENLESKVEEIQMLIESKPSM